MHQQKQTFYHRLMQLNRQMHLMWSMMMMEVKEKVGQSLRHFKCNNITTEVEIHHSNAYLKGYTSRICLCISKIDDQKYIFESQYPCETCCQMLDKNNMTQWSPDRLLGLLRRNTILFQKPTATYSQRGKMASHRKKTIYSN